MNATISKHRDQLSEFAPRILILKINPSKIGEVIGPGGKMIRAIIEETGAKIDIDDDGTVLIASVDGEAGRRALARVQAIVEEPEIGRIYNGMVRRIAEFRRVRRDHSGDRRPGAYLRAGCQSRPPRRGYLQGRRPDGSQGDQYRRRRKDPTVA